MNILSIDGGGIRGIIPAMALDALEQAIGKPVQEQFALMVGTSTGGILALALARGKRPADIVRLYEKRGSEIFSKKWYWLGMTGAKYAATGVEKVLREELGEAPVSTAMKDVAVTAFSLLTRDTVTIRSWEPGPSMSFWEAARVTSAAPTYFPEYLRMIDGGVWANNPSRLAANLAKRRHPGEQFRLLSLGTGRNAESFDGSLGWGKVAWLTRILALVMDAPLKQVERDCEREFGNRYMRVQVPLLGGEWPLDCTTPSYMSRLREAGYAASEAMEQIARSGWFSA